MHEPETTTVRVSGGDLHAEVFRPTTCRGVCIVTHGYGEHSGRYHEVADVLVRRGWLVLTYDVRGHGRSFGARGYVARFADYQDDVRAVIARAATLADAGLPRVLFGHSNGGLITLRALCDAAPPVVRAAVLSSPFLALRTPLPLRRRLVAHVASVVWPRLARPSGLHIEDLTTDAGKQAERRADALCFRVATARWFVESQRAQREVEAQAARIACPTLWLLGIADPIADPACSRRNAGHVPGAEVAVFEGMRHEVCNEVARAAVFDRIGEFLRRLQP